MSAFELLKNLHILFALISGLGYALREYFRIVLRRPLTHPLVRFGPHLIDTLLLATGIALWVMVAFSPLRLPWFGLKLILVVVYIVLGILSFRQPRQGPAVIAYLGALGVFLAIAWLALFKPI